METRKSDGSPCVPSSLRSLVCGLNRVLQKNKAPSLLWTIMTTGLLNTLDSLRSELHRQGVRAIKHSAKVIDPEHEDIFWQEGLLGYSSPKVIQRTVFFFMWILILFFEAYRNSTILFLTDSHVYLKIGECIIRQCTTSMSSLCPKIINRFKDTNMKNKNVRAYALPGNERCIMRLLDRYLSVLPQGCAYFYMRPFAKEVCSY